MGSVRCNDCGRDTPRDSVKRYKTELGRFGVCPRCVRDPARTKQGRGWRARGLAGVGLMLLMVVWPQRLGAFITAMYPLVVGYTGICWLRWRRARVPSARRLLTEDSRHPVLYLRSFDADKREIAIRESQAWNPMGSLVLAPEDRLAFAAGEYGPFVSVGRPGEKAPLGAARLYLQGTGWLEDVVALAGRSRCVVMRAGTTDGFITELRALTGSGAGKGHGGRIDPLRLLLWIPKRRRYAAFRERASAVLQHPLPERIESEFIVFDEEWHASSLRRGQGMRNTLAPYFRSIGAHRTPTSMWQRLPAAAWFAFVVGIGVLAFLIHRL